MPKKEGFNPITTVNEALDQVTLPAKVKWLVKPTFWMLLFLWAMSYIVPGGVGGGTDMIQFILGQLGDAGTSIIDAGKAIFGALVGSAEAVSITPASPGIPVEQLPVFDAVPIAGDAVSDSLQPNNDGLIPEPEVFYGT